MRRERLQATIALSLLTLSACTVVVEEQSQPEPEASRGPSTAVTLGVPPGHLPAPGRCRVWLPDTPPGHQPRARSCDGITATAPAGSMVLYRPGKDKKVVYVRYVDRRRAGVVVRVRVFDAKSGRFLREERPPRRLRSGTPPTRM